jgi:hypothetical protein
MSRKSVAHIFIFAVCLSITGAAAAAAAPADLSADEIVQKNVAARGGLQAWKAVQTISMEGKMGAGGNQRTPLPQPVPGKATTPIPTDQRPKEEVQLPFTMELQRPHKTRFELLFNGKKAIQVYDGANGWKLRPYLNRMEVEPFSKEELEASSSQADLDGYLVDYPSKGIRVESDGMEKVDGRDNYKLKLTLKDGHVFHLWIDAQTFLDTKIDGLPRRLDGFEHPVQIYYRDYRTVNGLQIPFLLETRVLPVNRPGANSGSTPIQVEKIVIDKVQINPPLAASSFSKPAGESATVTKPH